MAVYAADFETCDNRSLTGGTPTEVHVWLWAVTDITRDELQYGLDIHSFLYFMSEHPGDFWFHNLAFDGSHIIDALLRAGFTHTVKKKPLSGEFNTLISRQGRFYHIGITWGNGNSVDIYDSLKKYPMSLRALAKKLDLPLRKGELDYTQWRDYGHVPTREELAYMDADVLILSAAMREQYDRGYTRMTIGSECMHMFKQQGASRFAAQFPTLSPALDAELRLAYRGGVTQVDPKFAGKDVGPGISVDFNSMYPSMMLLKPFPWGKPRYFKGEYAQDKDYPLYIQRLTCAFTLKPDGVPMIQLKHMPGFGVHEYVRECLEPVTLSLCNLDLSLFFDNYDVDVWSYDGGYKFQQRKGMFEDYLSYWREVKENSVGADRLLAKLFSNNLYGKFGTNPDMTGKVPVMGEDGILHLVLGGDEQRDSVYIPVAIWATAYARDTLLRAAMQYRDRFIYCDTDSLHLLGTEVPDKLPLDDKKYGCWKVEGEFTHARHIRAKTYIWDLNGEVSVTCAGMPDNIKEDCDFDNFQIGYTNTEEYLDDNGNKHTRIKKGLGKLLPKMVKGGRTLVDAIYTLH